MAFEAHFIDAVVLDEDRDFAVVNLVLTVPRFLASRFTGDVLDRVAAALRAAGQEVGYVIDGISIDTPLAEAGWRVGAEAGLGQGPSNQAGVGPEPHQWLSEDGMPFRDAGELTAYRAFKRAQTRLPKHESLTILPNPGAKTRIDTTWSPDFFIAYRGRAGISRLTGPPTMAGRRPTRAGTGSSRTAASPTSTGGSSKTPTTRRPRRARRTVLLQLSTR